MSVSIVSSSSSSTAATGNVVLRRLFPGARLQSLHSFFSSLPRLAESAAWSLLRDDDSAAFVAFVHETLVARPAANGSSVSGAGAKATAAPCVGRAAMCTQNDVLLRVLELLYRRGEVVERNGVPANCLAAGYRPTRESSSAGLRGLEQLEMYTFTPSTHVLKKPLWRDLLARVGDDPMTYLLLNCVVLSPLPNRCYLQLTGTPLRPHLLDAESRVLPPFQAKRSIVVKRLLASHSQTATQTKRRRLPTADDAAAPTADVTVANSSAAVTESAGDGRKPRLSAWRRRKAKRLLQPPPSPALSQATTDAQGRTADGETRQPTHWQVKLRDELAQNVQRAQIFHHSNSLLQVGKTRFHPKHVLSVLTTPLPRSPVEWQHRARLLAHHVFCNPALDAAALLALGNVPLPKFLRGFVQPLELLLRLFAKCDVPLLLRVHCPIRLSAAMDDAAVGVPSDADGPEVFESTAAATPHHSVKRRRHHRSQHSNSATSQFAGAAIALSSTATPPPKRARHEHETLQQLAAVATADDVDLDDYAYFVLDMDGAADVEPVPTQDASPALSAAVLNPIVWPALDEQREHRRRREQRVHERQQLYQALNAASTATLLASHSSFHDVSRFVLGCLDRLLPLSLLGDKRNRRVLYARVERFVRMRRYEKMSTRELVDDISTTAFAVLQPLGAQHVDTETLLRQQVVVARLYRWIMNAVVVPLLASSLYATESHEHRNQTFFYRRPIWARIVAHWRDAQLGAPSAEVPARKVAFEAVPFDDAVRVMKRRHFAFSYARLLPKRGGRVRTIMNLGRRPSLYEQTLCDMRAGFAASINSTLAASHRVLQHETQATPDVLGATVFKWDDIYRRFLNFSRSWQAAGRPPLCACSIDVKNSFDSIEQAPLLDVVLGLLRQEQYYVQRWQSVGPNPHSGHLSLRYHRGVPPPHIPPHDVLGGAAARAQALRHAIVADLPPPRVVTRGELHEQLREHIQNNLVKDGGRFYRQRTGIPQGSVLSSLMCCAVYAHVERHCLAPLGLESVGGADATPYLGVLLRLIDDFLYITTAREAATKFTGALMHGFAEYGCTANAQKLQLNFALDGVATAPRAVLPWCGFLLDTTTLELRCDYTRFYDAHMNESLTVELAQHAGWSLERKVKHVLKMRLHPLLVDEQIVSRGTACANVFDAATLAALKFHAHTRALSRHNAAFELGVIVGAAEYAVTLLRDMPTSSVARELGMRSSVRASEIEYLILHAFALVMRRKPARYASVLEAVARRLNEAALAKAGRALRRVVDANGGGRAAHELMKRAK